MKNSYRVLLFFFLFTQMVLGMHNVNAQTNSKNIGLPAIINLLLDSNESQQANNGKVPDGFYAMVARTIFISNGLVVFPATGYVVLFDDGSMTRDIEGVFNGSVSSSMLNNPTLWGTWQRMDTELLLQFSGSEQLSYQQDAFSELRWWFLPTRGLLDEQITSNCYKPAFSVFSTLRWCFTDDQFEFIRGGVVDLRGSYQIEGYSMTLIGSTGQTRVYGFAFESPSKQSFMINGDTYILE